MGTLGVPKPSGNQPGTLVKASFFTKKRSRVFRNDGRYLMNEVPLKTDYSSAGWWHLSLRRPMP